jgi:hypothetical protein
VGNDLDSSTNFAKTMLVIVLNNKKIEAYRIVGRRKQFFNAKMLKSYEISIKILEL